MTECLYNKMILLAGGGGKFQQLDHRTPVDAQLPYRPTTRPQKYHNFPSICGSAATRHFDRIFTADVAPGRQSVIVNHSQDAECIAHLLPFQRGMFGKQTTISWRNFTTQNHVLLLADKPAGEGEDCSNTVGNGVSLQRFSCDEWDHRHSTWLAKIYINVENSMTGIKYNAAYRWGAAISIRQRTSMQIASWNLCQISHFLTQLAELFVSYYHIIKLVERCVLSSFVVVQRVASLGPSDAPWPRPISRLHRSAGGVSLLSFRIWSIHLQRGRPGRRFHLGSGFRQSDKLTSVQRAWWAGTVMSNLAMWPKTALRRREIMSDMDGSPVVTVISSLRMNCCQLTCRQHRRNEYYSQIEERWDYVGK